MASFLLGLVSGVRSAIGTIETTPDLGDFLHYGQNGEFENANLPYVGKLDTYSYKPTITAGKLISMELFEGFTQTTINRRAKTTLTYTGANVTNESTEIYDPTDGTTVIKTINIDHTYTGSQLTKSEVTP